MRIAISRRAAAPKGGRPTRRIASIWAGEASGMSEKSILRRIGRPLFAARAARADDADALAIVLPPHGVGHDEHVAGRRAAQPQEPRVLLRKPSTPDGRGVRG